MEHCIQCGQEVEQDKLLQGICGDCLDQLIAEEDAYRAMEMARSMEEERQRYEAEEETRGG